MPLGPDELVELRDELVRARARGLRTLEYDGKRLTYGSDAELATAIADLDGRIRAAGHRPRPGAVAFSSSKGF